MSDFCSWFTLFIIFFISSLSKNEVINLVFRLTGKCSSYEKSGKQSPYLFFIFFSISSSTILKSFICCWASLNDIFEDSRLDYITFQKARINYNNSIECKELIEDLAICIKTSKKLEKMISKDYAELVMIKEENYNIRMYSTFIFRNLKRYEELLDTDIFDVLLDSLLDDE